MRAKMNISTPPLSATSWAWPPPQTTTRSPRSPTTATMSFGWPLPAKASSPPIPSAPTPPVGGLPSERRWFPAPPRCCSASTPIATKPALSNPSPTPSPSPPTSATAAWTSTRPSPPGANPSAFLDGCLPQGCPTSLCESLEKHRRFRLASGATRTAALAMLMNRQICLGGGFHSPSQIAVDPGFADLRGFVRRGDGAALGRRGVLFQQRVDHVSQIVLDLQVQFTH